MPCEPDERDERKWDGAIENANIWVFVWISINKTHMHIGSPTLTITLFFLILTNDIYYSQTKFNQYTFWFQRKNEFYPKSKVEFQPIYIYTFTYILYHDFSHHHGNPWVRTWDFLCVSFAILASHSYKRPTIHLCFGNASVPMILIYSYTSCVPISNEYQEHGHSIAYE